MKDPVSQEYVNAFVDGELAADERERALERLDRDGPFKALVCETRTLKDLVKGGYADIPLSSGHAHGHERRGLVRQAMAAGLLLAFGGGLGWLAHDRLQGNTGPVVVAGLPTGYAPVSLAEAVDPDRMVLHLDASDPRRFVAILDLAERLARERRQGGRVEVVVNSYGLDLLRADKSPHAGRIASLAGRYDNLSFIACGQSIARFRREGVDVRLLPQARVASSAINQIMARMRHGWVYVKV